MGGRPRVLSDWLIGGVVYIVYLCPPAVCSPHARPTMMASAWESWRLTQTSNAAALARVQHREIGDLVLPVHSGRGGSAGEVMKWVFFSPERFFSPCGEDDVMIAVLSK